MLKIQFYLEAASHNFYSRSFRISLKLPLLGLVQNGCRTNSSPLPWLLCGNPHHHHHHHHSSLSWATMAVYLGLIRFLHAALSLAYCSQELLSISNFSRFLFTVSLNLSLGLSRLRLPSHNCETVSRVAAEGEAGGPSSQPVRAISGSSVLACPPLMVDQLFSTLLR